MLKFVPFLNAMCNCQGVFPRYVCKNPNFHQGLSQCSMQMCINSFLSGQGEKNRKRYERGVKGKKKKEKQPLQMLHNCTEQMNINVTVKLKWRKNVSRQHTVLELEDSRTCFAYEEVNAQGERERGSAPVTNECLLSHTLTACPSKKKKYIPLKRQKLVRTTTMFHVTGSSEKFTFRYNVLNFLDLVLFDPRCLRPLI